MVSSSWWHGGSWQSSSAFWLFELGKVPQFPYAAVSSYIK